MVITGSPLWALIVQSDGMTWFILLLLLALSITVWTVALQKILLLRTLVCDAKNAVQQLAHIQNPDALAVMFNAPLYGRQGIADHLARLREVAELAARERTAPGLWSYEEVQLLRDEFSLKIHVFVEELSKSTALLRVAADASPLLGLLGTIWGLIHSFMRITMEQSADIVTVAPGIAEALVTTLMGLIVAIPALCLFHLVQRFAEQYEELLYRIAYELESIYGRRSLCVLRD